MFAATLLLADKRKDNVQTPHKICDYMRIARISTNCMMYDELEFDVILVKI
jgi:hypothetical protein